MGELITLSSSPGSEQTFLLSLGFVPLVDLEGLCTAARTTFIAHGCPQTLPTLTLCKGWSASHSNSNPSPLRQSASRLSTIRYTS